MKKKEAMKVIAAAGIAIGGMGMFQDGNVVYAAELDQNGEGGSDELVFSAEERTQSSEEPQTRETSESAEPSSEQINENVSYTDQDSGFAYDDGTGSAAYVDSAASTDSVASTESTDSAAGTESTYGSETVEQPVPENPTPIEPAPVDPVPVEPVPVDPVPVEPAPADPAPVDSVESTEDINSAADNSADTSEASASDSEAAVYDSETADSDLGSVEHDSTTTASDTEASASDSEDSVSDSEASTTESEASASDSEASMTESEVADELPIDGSDWLTPTLLSKLRIAQAKLASGEELTAEEQALIDRSTAESLAWSETNSTLLSESASGSTILSEVYSNVLSESESGSVALSEGHSTLLSESESNSTVLSEAQSTLLSESTFASESLSGHYSTMLSGSESGSAKASEAMSGVASQSESASTSVSTSMSTSQSTAESMNTATSESVSLAQSEFDSAVGPYEESADRLAQIEELRKAIEKQEKIVWDIIDRNNTWKNNYDVNGTGEYDAAAKELACLLIQYKMLSDAQEHHYTEVTFPRDSDGHLQWTPNHNKKNQGAHMTVTYKDENGVLQTKYFDYVTVNAKGEVIENRDDKSGIIGPKNGVDARQVKYLYIIELFDNDNDGNMDIQDINEKFKNGSGYFSEKDFVDGKHHKN